jgi:hypothetical protein
LLYAEPSHCSRLAKYEALLGMDGAVRAKLYETVPAYSEPEGCP